MPQGEASKTLRTVEAIISAMERERYGRDTLLIALGGGVVMNVHPRAAMKWMDSDQREDVVGFYDSLVSGDPLS